MDILNSETQHTLRKASFTFVHCGGTFRKIQTAHVLYKKKINTAAASVHGKHWHEAEIINRNGESLTVEFADGEQATVRIWYLTRHKTEQLTLWQAHTQ